MELVIKINDNDYEAIKSRADMSEGYDNPIDNAILAITNGTPLPKGHGDLITKEQAIELVEFYQINPQHFDFVNLIDEIKDEKPVIVATIDADKEHKE